MRRFPWEPQPEVDAETLRERQLRAKRSQGLGRIGEAKVQALLVSMGVRRLKVLHTGMAKIAGAYRHARRVDGDLSGVLPGGRHVHCEAKHRQGVLAIPDFQRHQLEALDGYHQLGALSLVGWSSSEGALILRWPIAGLAKGHRLTWSTARTLALSTLPPSGPNSPTPAPSSR